MRSAGASDSFQSDGLTSALADGGGREHRANSDVVYTHRLRTPRPPWPELFERPISLSGARMRRATSHRKVGLPQVNAVRVARESEGNVVVYEEQGIVVAAQLSQPDGHWQHVALVSRLVPQLQDSRPAAQCGLRDLHDGTAPRGVGAYDDVEAVDVGCIISIQL